MCLQAARSTDMSDYRLFPCLRATADLVMMPKEVGREGWGSVPCFGGPCFGGGRAGACWTR